MKRTIKYNNQIMKKVFLLFLTLLCIPTLWADEKPTFTTSAPDVVAVGDQFRLSYTVSTQKVKNFRAPGSISGFDILMGPSRSQQSSVQIINGQRTSTSTITFTYILLATKEGTFTIPGATIDAEGEKLISNSIQVKVLPEDDTAKKKAQGQNQSDKSSSDEPKVSLSKDDLFITATVNKTNIYEQEALTLTFKIYSAVDLRGFENIKLPDFTGFHSQEIELANQKWGLEHHNGRNYQSTIYRQFVLFPQQAGQLTIEPAQFDAIIAQAIRSIDPFDAFFNGGSNYANVKKTLYTPKITVNVKPLPSGKPATFTGGVGQFTISSSINDTEIKANDAITLKLVISGTGNMKLLSNPAVEFPEDFEIYDPKVNNQVRLTSQGLTGNKSIEYLAIPRHGGTYKIPEVKFSYFDTSSNSYKTLTTEAYTINVQKSKGEGTANQMIADFTNKEEIKVLGEDIRFIKLNDVDLHPRDQFFFGTWGYWLFYIISSVAFILILIAYRKQLAEYANVAKRRVKKANKVAAKRLKSAGKLMERNKKEEFYDETLKALWGYVSDKLNIPVSKLSKDNVEEELTQYGVAEELIKEFINTLNECEFARYAPGDENQAMDNVYKSAMSIISKMEDSIKKN